MQQTEVCKEMEDDPLTKTSCQVVVVNNAAVNNNKVGYSHILSSGEAGVCNLVYYNDLIKFTLSRYYVKSILKSGPGN